MMSVSAWHDRRYWLAGAIAAAAVIVAAAYFFFIHPELAATAAYRSQTTTVQAQSGALRARVAELAKEHANIGALRARLVRAFAGLPPDSGLPAFTREASIAAAVTHVRLDGVSVGSVTAFGSGGTSATGAATGTPAATGAPTAAPATSPVGQLFQISVTVTSTGALRHQLAFLTDLEQGARRVLVTGSQVTNTGGRHGQSIDQEATFTTSLLLFSAPMSTGQAAQLSKLLAAGS